MAAMAAMLAGGAHAQSGVTIFGVMDTGVEVPSNAPYANDNASCNLAQSGAGLLYSFIASTLMCKVTASLTKGT